MYDKIKHLFAALRWKIVRWFAHDIEQQFLFKNAESLKEKISKWCFARLNREEFDIKTDQDVMIRVDENRTLLLAGRQSVLEREVAYRRSFYLLDFASPLLKDNTVCLDIGANSGVFSVPLAMRFPHVSFYCFEPHPVLCNRLQTNIAINRLSNVHAVQRAVTENGQPVTLFSQELGAADNWGLSSTVYSPAIGVHNQIQVESVTCDQFKQTHVAKQAVSFMKIDVQGAELDVLKGARLILQEDRPVVVFEHEDEFFKNPQSIKDEMKKFFDQLGYKVFVLSKRFRGFYVPVNWDATISVDLVAVPGPPPKSN